jgi:ribonuclease D
VIDTDEQVKQLAEAVAQAQWIAIDTEADSLYSYPERLCLLQVSLPEMDVIVDPLAKIDLTPLLEVMAGRELILHGADYDLRLLHKMLGFRPSHVFDTMIASRLLGERRFGLSALVEQHLGVALPKTLQKANWARRPLPRKLEQYASDDTKYLRPLSEILRAALEKAERLDWHRESCDQLIEECGQIKEPDPDRDWRIRGSNSLDRQGLAVLRELWLWREQEALRVHRPPYFVVSHEGLVEIANQAGKVPADQLSIPSRISRKRRQDILGALSRGLSLPKRRWPPERLPNDHGGPRRPINDELYKELRRRRDRKAEQLGIDPSLIASRSSLEKLARSSKRSPGDLLPWQRALLGFEPSVLSS